MVFTPNKLVQYFKFLLIMRELKIIIAGILKNLYIM